MRLNAKTKSPLSPAALAAIALTGILIAMGLWFAAAPSRAPPSLIGGPFTLETAGGKTVSDADFRGHPFLVYFGYTHCPDVCPTTLAQIADVLHKIPDQS